MIWELDEALPPSTHRYKYRLFYGAAGVGRVRYDNERGKGDHRHLGDVEHRRRHRCGGGHGVTSRLGLALLL